ncbi:MAG: ABC transporter substrate-binding protein [Pseudonocardiaceae bacterium]
MLNGIFWPGSATDRAAQSSAELREQVDNFRSGPPNMPQRRVAELQVYDNVIYAAGNTSMEHTRLEILGLDNIFADAGEQFIEPSLEELIARDPEVVIPQYDFVDGDGPPKTLQQTRKEFLAPPSVQEMQAVRTGAVLGVPVGEAAADPLAVDGLATLSRALTALR